jgi:hypothetical protein
VVENSILVLVIAVHRAVDIFQHTTVILFFQVNDLARQRQGAQAELLDAVVTKSRDRWKLIRRRRLALAGIVASRLIVVSGSRTGELTNWQGTPRL